MSRNLLAIKRIQVDPLSFETEDGTVYELVSQEPYTRRDGEQSFVATWSYNDVETGERATCQTGETFEPRKLPRRAPGNFKPGIALRPVEQFRRTLAKVQSFARPRARPMFPRVIPS